MVLEDGAPPVDPAAINVATDVSLQVQIDGQYIGNTPLDLVVEAGTHEVVLRSEQHTAIYTMDASDGVRWCFTARGKKGIQPRNCR